MKTVSKRSEHQLPWEFHASMEVGEEVRKQTEKIF